MFDCVVCVCSCVCVCVCEASGRTINGVCSLLIQYMYAYMCMCCVCVCVCAQMMREMERILSGMNDRLYQLSMQKKGLIQTANVRKVSF